MTFKPIGTVFSAFKEKFGVPRQSMMLDAATAVLRLHTDTRFHAAVQGLESFSHIWVIYLFHRNFMKKWHPTVEVPRTDSQRRVGVFGTRSPHRPNPIGMSAVRLERIDLDTPTGIELHLRGVDILDGTPVLDIKPYLPYADKIDAADSGWIKGSVLRYPVCFSPESLLALAARPSIRQLVAEMLSLDPRPTSQRRARPIERPDSDGARYAFRVADVDVHWEIRKNGPYVLQILPA